MPTTTAYTREDLRLYLDYLEKEMTIMGVLSAFCALAPGLTIKELLQIHGASAANVVDIWTNGRLFIVAATFLILAAAGFFYGQRSTLAWFYGQISLAFIDPKMTGRSVEDWLRDADSWATWNRYKRSFLYLTLGAIGYSLALAGTAFTVTSTRVQVWFGVYISTAVIAVLIEAQVERIYKSYRYEESPLSFERLIAIRMKPGSEVRGPSFWGRK
ncbi:MAG TPA: hypothetical protein VMU41_14435 [Candidatus Binataceae bacterium]|nr:hypothetical protein [Candidatus Binataceae bacterium]